MKIPTELKHKPVFVCENYSDIDGRKSYNSDAVGLSLGLAQWNDRGRVDISAKVWRHTGEKWSRQSEELPLHRVVDLAILLCRVKEYMREEYHLSEPESGLIDRIGLQGDAMTISLCRDNAMLKSDKGLFSEALARDDEFLSQRLFVLSSLLKKLGY